MEINTKQLIEYYLEEENITRASKRLAEVEGIEYNDNFRRKCSRILGKQDVDLDNITVTETNQYPKKDDIFMPSAWDSEKDRFLSIDEYCDRYGLPKEQVRSSKLVAHLDKHMIYNIAFEANSIESSGIDEEFIESIVEKHIKPISLTTLNTNSTNSWFDRVVITDIHIGMDVNGGRNTSTLYEGKWDKEALFDRLNQLTSHIKKFKKGSTLVIDELGDYLDGFLGQTTRGGHSLPQNMSDKEAFELGVEFKLTLIDNLVNDYHKIVCNNITDDNHSGVFSYFVNSTVKKIIEARYTSDKVEYNLMEKFINHYSQGSHTFLLSHGKDSESLKFGFKPILDTKQAEKIDQYCKEYQLYDGKHIEFSKGDSHLCLLDYTTSNDFDYCNYPSFSPPSQWVKVNFKNSRSGFVFYNIDEHSNTKITTPYWF